MIWFWIGFIVLILALLALDLGVFHRKAHVISFREAMGWSAFWIFLGLAFTVFIYYGYENQWAGLGAKPDPIDRRINDGRGAAVKYLTGYVVEKSLSVDNIFVIAMIFAATAVPAIYQHRVLFWGIVGALVLRGLMIGIGAQLIARFHWILYLFGAFLIFTAIKMLLMRESHDDPSNTLAVRLARRFFPITAKFHGEHFFVRAGSKASHETAVPGAEAEDDPVVDRSPPGKLLLTPLALTLVMIEATDVIFAVDSIPAVFAITADPFIVFTSNVFAILGLRSLYFALAGMIRLFRYLKLSLAFVLLLIGTKMMAAEPLKERLGENFNFYVLGAVLGILSLGVVASIIAERLSPTRDAEPLPPDVPPLPVAPPDTEGL